MRLLEASKKRQLSQKNAGYHLSRSVFIHILGIQRRYHLSRSVFIPILGIKRRYQEKKYSEHKESGKNQSVDQKQILSIQETARTQEAVMEKTKDTNEEAIEKTRKR